MKTLLISLLVMINFNVEAGTLENRSTGEILDLTLNRNSQTLEIYSNSPLVSNKVINLLSIRRDQSNINIISLNDAVTDGAYYNDQVVFSFIVPIYFIPRYAAVVGDLLALPVKLPMKLIQEARFNKDYKKLQRAINSNAVIEVSDSRFSRIAKLLK
jgi:hypothetical protein